MSKKITDEIRVRAVPHHMNEEINNVAKNMGTNVSSLVKTKIAEYLATVPDALKKTRN